MAQTQAEIFRDGYIDSEDIAADAITTEKIDTGAVTKEKLADSVKPEPFTTRGFNIPL